MTRTSNDGRHLIELLGDIDFARLEREIGDHLNGHPRAASFDGDRVSGFTTVLDDDGNPSPAVADPTGEAAINPDQARTDLDLLRSETAELLRRARLVWSVSQRYLPTTRPDAGQIAKLTEQGDPGCWYCLRVLTDHGKPWWEPPLTANPTTVKGNLPEARFVCRWCYDHIGRTGRGPSLPESRAHYRKRGQRERGAA